MPDEQETTQGSSTTVTNTNTNTSNGQLNFTKDQINSFLSYTQSISSLITSSKSSELSINTNNLNLPNTLSTISISAKSLVLNINAKKNNSEDITTASISISQTAINAPVLSLNIGTISASQQINLGNIVLKNDTIQTPKLNVVTTSGENTQSTNITNNSIMTSQLYLTTSSSNILLQATTIGAKPALDIIAPVQFSTATTNIFIANPDLSFSFAKNDNIETEDSSISQTSTVTYNCPQLLNDIEYLHTLARGIISENKSGSILNGIETIQTNNIKITDTLTASIIYVNTLTSNGPIAGATINATNLNIASNITCNSTISTQVLSASILKAATINAPKSNYVADTKTITQNTIIDSDYNGAFCLINSTDMITITLPAAPDKFEFEILNLGTGGVTIARANTTTTNLIVAQKLVSSCVLKKQYQIAGFKYFTTNNTPYWIVTGDATAS